ncbi:MAG TPA: EAL domain-containing protein [Kofleriaceae bacterium]|jgi:diguanylate cyclase (GGDEF)-like protein
MSELPIVNILIVDDRPENLLALEISLESLGQRIVRASSGQQALKAVLDEEFAVILMDIRMPGMDGFETLELLRKREKSRHIPIIFLTAHSEQRDFFRTWSAGAVDCLEKPIDPDALRAKVSVFVALRQNQLELEAAQAQLEQRIIERTADLQTEIERRKGVEAKLLEQATHDALTGLANRKLLLEHLTHATSRWNRRRSSKFAVAMIDLDRFKVVNDTLGHLGGDQLLVEVAARLQHCLRAGDTAARLGGDEFAILLDGISELRDATRTTERIHRALNEPFIIDGRDVRIGGSIGLAMIDERYTQGEELLRDADTALYRAKDAGRSRTQVFDQEMHEHVQAELRDEQELGLAIEREEMCLFYQPIVDLASGNIVGFEALMRWAHPERGLVDPDRFIALAEETGLIRPLGRWAIDAACAQLVAFRRATPQPLVMSVNVSANQLSELGFATHVARALHEHSLPPSLLEVELTESTMMQGTAIEAHELGALRDLGVSLALDDFGTGYSCLASLQQLNVGKLKIDQSFIAPLGTSEERPEIVTAIIALARALHLDIVAEGIETTAQLELLRSLGCTHGQGFLFSPPVSAGDATALLRSRRRMNAHVR